MWPVKQVSVKKHHKCLRNLSETFYSLENILLYECTVKIELSQGTTSVSQR